MCYVVSNFFFFYHEGEFNCSSVLKSEIVSLVILRVICVENMGYN